ncbi:MAG: sulfatase [Planctomycetota bacterium]
MNSNPQKNLLHDSGICAIECVTRLARLAARILFASALVLTASLAFESPAAGQNNVEQTTVDRAPNIVLIISDDQAWTDYGFMGHEVIETPNIDRLARQSAVFRRGYVPTALCRSSLATLITGHYAHRHGITGNDPAPVRNGGNEYKQLRARLISHLDNFQTVPRLLSEQGYISHQSGKWWEGSYLRGGFTAGMTRGFPNQGGRHGDDGLEIGRQGMEPVFSFIDDAAEQGRPFFVWYAPFLPHTPHNPPERLLEKYTSSDRSRHVAKYYAMCEWFDETVGALVDHIDESGQRENTMIIYVTDNGWIQREDRGGFAPRSKQSPNEGGTRTPIMFSWPGTIAPADRPELCSSVDIVPTILSATGSQTPERLPGLDLMSALKDGAAIDRQSIFGEQFSHDVADVLNPQASLNYRWVIHGQWKLILTYDGSLGRVGYPPTDFRPQLYDLLSDPFEKENVAAANPDAVAALAQEIEAWWPVDQRTTVTRWSDEPVVLETGQ